MFWTVTLSLLEGLVVLLRIFAMTLLFSLPLGLLIAFGSMSKWAPLRALRHKHPKLAAFRPVSGLFNLIVWVIRGTPPVSYTHLDVYKRQLIVGVCGSLFTIRKYLQV